MEPLYTAETRNQIERVLSVFRDYIVTTNYFDILYSKKVGYVYFDINPKRMKVAENNCFVIENGEQLARRLAYDMAIDIMEEVGHCLDPHEATPLEKTASILLFEFPILNNRVYRHFNVSTIFKNKACNNIFHFISSLNIFVQ